MKLTNLLGILGGCFLCACSADESFEQIPALPENSSVAGEQVITVTTAEIDAPLTRIAATIKPGGGYTFPWQNNDQIAVYGSSSEAKGWGFFTLVSGSGEATGNFKGIFKLQPEVDYYSFYPALDLKSGTSATAVPVDYTGQKQTADASLAHLDKYIYMTAKGDADFNFASKHVGSLVKIQLKDENYYNINKIVLYLPTEGSFVLKGTIDLTTATSTAAPVITSTQKATTFEMEYSAGSATLADNTITAYAMLAPTNLAGKQIQAMVMHNNGVSAYYDLTTDKEDTFVAGKAYTFTATPVAPSTTDFVDLGLPSGTLWATYNIGADKPEDSGYYFAWGEVSPKETYTWDNYQFGNTSSLNKYCTDNTKGTVDNKKELDSEDDAAYRNWGPDWCMPTSEQMNELINGEYTTQEWTTLNGAKGLKITSKKYTDRSIFLPAAGLKADDALSYKEEYAHYWSKSLYESNPTMAKYLESSSIESEVTSGVRNMNRRLGYPVRAVRNVIIKPEFLDLGLPSGTLWATCNIGANKPEDYGDYFAWGEVSPKETYSWGNYKFGDARNHALSKYCTNSAEGTVDNKKELDPEDDAASVNWSGENCCMPTSVQMEELFNEAYTTHEWTTLNGVTGLKITSKTYTDRFIFLPAAGYKANTIDESGNFTYYWTKSLAENFPYFAAHLSSDSDDIEFGYINRFIGYSVRAVKVKLQ